MVLVGLAAGVVVVASRTLARRSGVPYPVFLVVAGALVSLLPGVPVVTLDPRLVFLGLLPPLVYHAGVVTSPRELRANALPVGLSALGLVLATTFAVAAAAWGTGTGIGWGAAFVLGTVVAPTDPVASTSVLERLGGPPHVTTILEGESLVNDGVALSLFAIAVTSVSSSTGVGGGFVDFVRVAVGGTVFGLAVGMLFSRLRRPLRDPASQVVVSLFVPYVAYLPANALGLSGVLATLTTGLLLGQRPAGRLSPAGRLRIGDFWQVLVFLLESVLFVLVGMQLRHVVAGIHQQSAGRLALITGVTVGAAVVVRLAWWLALPTIRWRPEGRLLDTGEVPFQERLVLGWTGLRGAISLAAALSVPTVAAGRPFPDRGVIIFATFCVIVVTMAGQGTTLPWLLRRLSLVGSEVHRHQHALADRRCAEAALRKLDELVAAEEVSDAVADGLRDLYERRLQRLEDEWGEEVGAGKGGLSWGDAYRQLLGVQRQVLTALHSQGQISFSVMRQVDRELDLEQARLEP